MNLFESIFAIVGIGGACIAVIALIIKSLSPVSVPRYSITPNTSTKREPGKPCGGGYVKTTIGRSQPAKRETTTTSAIADPWNVDLSQPNNDTTNHDTGVISDYGSGNDFGTFG